jgi:flagellar biosynthesis regulator FlbT
LLADSNSSVDNQINKAAYVAALFFYVNAEERNHASAMFSDDLKALLQAQEDWCYVLAFIREEICLNQEHSWQSIQALSSVI